MIIYQTESRQCGQFGLNLLNTSDIKFLFLKKKSRQVTKEKKTFHVTNKKYNKT